MGSAKRRGLRSHTHSLGTLLFPIARRPNKLAFSTANRIAQEVVDVMYEKANCLRQFPVWSMYYAEKSLILKAKVQNSHKHIVKNHNHQTLQGNHKYLVCFGNNTTLRPDRDRMLECKPSEKLSPQDSFLQPTAVQYSLSFPET